MSSTADLPIIKMLGYALKKDEKGRIYASYRMQVSHKGETWRVAKRYSEFDRLHQQLETYDFLALQSSLPKFPDKKKIVGNLERQFLHEREEKLFAYLQGVLSHTDYGNHKTFVSFLHEGKFTDDTTLDDVLQYSEAKRQPQNSPQAKSKPAAPMSREIHILRQDNDIPPMPTELPPEPPSEDPPPPPV